MDNHHDQLIRNISEQMKPVLDASEQGIYIYLDENHKVCNKKFASFLGYSSPEEWGKVEKDFISAFVDPKSQDLLVNAYNTAMEKMSASTVKITWVKKSGATLELTVVLVPIAYEDHLLALHFVS